MISTSDKPHTTGSNETQSTNQNDQAKKKHHHTRKNFKQNSSKPGAKKWDSNKSDKNSANDQGPYVVIIKNAENDLSRIHHEALPAFLGLNKNQIKKQTGSSYYDLKIRSETRTAEISFFGSEEDRYFKVFNVHHGKEKKIAGQKRHRGDDENSTSKAGLNEGEEDNQQSIDSAADGTADGASQAPKYASVLDMIHSVSVKDYFFSPLHYSLLEDECDEKDTKTAANQPAEGDDAANVNQLDNVKYISAGSRAGARLDSLQDHLVTSIADTNTKCTPKHLRKVLSDVPGFVSAWFMRSCGANSSTFRVVFESMDMLFAAKEILDQFGADRDMKVTLKLSDFHESKFNEYLLKKAAAEL